jgi:hypothetical protein
MGDCKLQIADGRLDKERGTLAVPRHVKPKTYIKETTF